jgi:hypothetical protein
VNERCYRRAVATRSSFVRIESVIGVGGVVADVDLDPVHLAGEGVGTG